MTENAAAAKLPEAPAAPDYTTSNITRYAYLPRPLKVLFVLSGVIVMVLFTIYVRGYPLKWPWSDALGMVMQGTFFFLLPYTIIGCNVFMGFGAMRKQCREAPKWFDYLLSLVLFGGFIFALSNAAAIDQGLLQREASAGALAVAAVLLLLTLEAARRVGGWALLSLLLLFLAYLLFADRIPGIFYGRPDTFRQLLLDFTYHQDGLLGLPGILLRSVVVGFLAFGGIFFGLGGGVFVARFWRAVFGRRRGAAAKAAVVTAALLTGFHVSAAASAGFTATVTLPRMAEAGSDRTQAAGLLNGAAAGGYFVPPLMVGLVFLMLTYGMFSYLEVALALLLPFLIIITAMLVQTDAQAARRAVSVPADAETPRFWPTLRQGWRFAAGVLGLVCGVLWFRWGYLAPLYAGGLLLVLSLLPRPRRELWRRWEAGFANFTGFAIYMLALFAAIGIVMLTIFTTGMAATVTNVGVFLLGADLFHVVFPLILMLEALVFGYFGLQIIGYVMLIPAFSVMSLAAGQPPEHILAAVISVICYLALGGILPGGKYSRDAAHYLKVRPVTIGLASLKPGVVLAVLPLLLFLGPELLLVGATGDNQFFGALAGYGPGRTLGTFVVALLGLWWFASGIGGYLLKVGPLNGWQRLVFTGCGLAVAVPEWISSAAGASLGVAVVTLLLISRRRAS